MTKSLNLHGQIQSWLGCVCKGPFMSGAGAACQSDMPVGRYAGPVYSIVACANDGGGIEKPKRTSFLERSSPALPTRKPLSVCLQEHGSLLVTFKRCFSLN